MKSIGQKAPELLDQVRNGIIGVPDAKKLSKLPEDERQEPARSDAMGTRSDQANSTTC